MGWFFVGLAGFLGYGAWTDLRRREIPEWVPWVIGLGGFGYNLASSHGWGAILGLAIGGVTLLPWLLNYLGGGDVKLFMALGLALGPAVLVLMGLTLVLAGLIGLVGLVRHKASFAMPLAPVMWLSLFLFWGGLRWLNGS